MNFFNTDLVFNPELLILCQNEWGPREPGARRVVVYHSGITLIGIFTIKQPLIFLKT